MDRSGATSLIPFAVTDRIRLGSDLILPRCLITVAGRDHSGYRILTLVLSGLSERKPILSRTLRILSMLSVSLSEWALPSEEREDIVRRMKYMSGECGG